MSLLVTSNNCTGFIQWVARGYVTITYWQSKLQESTMTRFLPYIFNSAKFIFYQSAVHRVHCLKQLPSAGWLLLLFYCHSPHRTVGILFCAFALATVIRPLLDVINPSCFPTPWSGLPVYFSFYCYLNKAIWSRFPMSKGAYIASSTLTGQADLWWPLTRQLNNCVVTVLPAGLQRWQQCPVTVLSLCVVVDDWWNRSFAMYKRLQLARPPYKCS